MFQGDGSGVQQMLGCQSREQLASDNDDSFFLIQIFINLYGYHGQVRATHTLRVSFGPQNRGGLRILVLSDSVHRPHRRWDFSCPHITRRLP